MIRYQPVPQYAGTSHIPILFLTQRDERSDKIAGLELGADDYITKPFDIEELKLRVQNAIKRAQWENLTSPTTGLPSGKLIEEQLRMLMRRKDWAILYVGVNYIAGFNEAYGFVAGELFGALFELQQECLEVSERRLSDQNKGLVVFLQ